MTLPWPFLWLGLATAVATAAALAVRAAMLASLRPWHDRGSVRSLESVASFVDQYRVQHELRRRILQRLRREGLSVAVPARSVRVDQGAGNGRAPTLNAPGSRSSTVPGAGS